MAYFSYIWLRLDIIAAIDRIFARKRSTYEHNFLW